MSRFDDNVSLVYKVFNDNFSDKRWLEEDLIQEGMMGLLNACNAFDESKGIAFSTFATKCILNQMRTFLRKEMPRSVRTVSLDAIIDEAKGPISFLEAIEEPAEQGMSEERKELLKLVLEIAKDLPAYELLCMKLQGMKQSQIAKKLGISPVSVSERLRADYAEIRVRVEKLQLKK